MRAIRKAVRTTTRRGFWALVVLWYAPVLAALIFVGAVSALRAQKRTPSS